MADATEGVKAVKNLTAKAQRLAAKLRTPRYAAKLKRRGLPKPVLCVETRWASTHTMLKTLEKLRPSIDDIVREESSLQVTRRSGSKQRQRQGKSSRSGKILTNLSASEWRLLSSYCRTLEPAAMATLRLQKEQLTAGDFFKIWLVCKEETRVVKTPLGKRLVAAMERREGGMLQSRIFAPALYMDPRFKSLLSEQQQTEARLYLAALWARIKALEEESVRGSGDAQGEAHIDVESSAEVSATDEEDDFLERMLRQRDGAGNPAPGPASSDPAVDIVVALHEYGRWPRLEQKADITEFWTKQRNKSSDPQLNRTLNALATLGEVMLSTPMTQVSVERTFSHLHHIFNVLRYNLSSEMISDILFIKCNFVFKHGKD